MVPGDWPLRSPPDPSCLALLAGGADDARVRLHPAGDLRGQFAAAVNPRDLVLSAELAAILHPARERPWRAGRDGRRSQAEVTDPMGGVVLVRPDQLRVQPRQKVGGVLGSVREFHDPRMMSGP